MKRAHVFLSHNTADKSYVEALAHRLQDAGIEPWLDKWNLQDALRQSYSGLAAVLRRSGKEKEAQDASQKAQALSEVKPLDPGQALFHMAVAENHLRMAKVARMLRDTESERTHQQAATDALQQVDSRAQEDVRYVDLKNQLAQVGL